MRSRRTLAVLGAAGAVTTPSAAAAAVPLHAPLAGAPTLRSQMRTHQHDRLLAIHRRLAGRDGAGVRFWSNERLRRDNRRLRDSRRLRASASPAGGELAAIRLCESGGDYTADTGNGFYGAYQFTQASWEAVGGTGNPAAASPAEQDRRAAALLARSGAASWPVCGA